MHGSYGSPEENWFRWLEKELHAQGHQVILEQFPVDDYAQVKSIGLKKINTYLSKQSLSIWENYFVLHILPKIKNETINFVGHSIAPIFMLHMLQKYDFKIGLAIWVAPFFNIPDESRIWQFYPVNKTFYGYDFDFDKIKKQLGESIVVCGDDDPYVPATEFPLFAEKLGAKIIVIPKGGHCGGVFKEFSLLKDLINNSK